MLEEGESVTENDEDAVKQTRELVETRKAAEQGDAEAQFNLGRMYKNGDEGVPNEGVPNEGVPKNDVEAVKWFRKAAEQGDTKGQYLLGWMYANGEGVPKNDEEAVSWYRKAADQRDASAQFNLIMLKPGRII